MSHGFGTPGTAPAQPSAATPTDAQPLPGSGWLGMEVGPSTEAGRWIVTEVTAGGPAALAGIVVHDEIWAMQGRRPMSLDELSALVTAVAAGQRVKMAVPRSGGPVEVEVIAWPRPTRQDGNAPRPTQDPDVVPTAGTDGGDRYAGRQPSSRFQQPDAGPAPDAVTDPTPAPAARPLGERIPRQATGPAVVPPGSPTPSAASGPNVWAGAPAGPRVMQTPRPTAPREEPAVFPGPVAAAPPRGRGRTALGVRTVPIDASTQARFRLPRQSGAYVIGVFPELPAGKAGVPAGSVIVALGEQPVTSPEDLTALVVNSPVDRPVPIQYVLPGGEPKRAEVVLQSLELPFERAIVGPEPAVPTNPRRADRPLGPAEDETVRGLRDEMRRLRERLEWIERRLGSLEPRTP